MCQVVKKHLESRMLGNLHVRVGVGAGVELPGPHHYEFSGRNDCVINGWFDDTTRRSVG